MIDNVVGQRPAIVRITHRLARIIDKNVRQQFSRNVLCLVRRVAARVFQFVREDARDNASVEHAAFVDLGLIKGNIGDQNYILGSDLDLAKYRTVSVWCKRFSKNFGAALLMPAAQSTR